MTLAVTWAMSIPLNQL